ncbi:MAG: hypothetical protein ABIP95_09200 [Pelobium sp.]
MKLKPTYLFLFLSFIPIVIGLFWNMPDADMTFRGNYYSIDFLEIQMLITVVSVIITLFYSWMNSIEKPISYKIAYWHFGLTVAGLIFMLLFLSTSISVMKADDKLSYFPLISIALGFFLLLAGFVIFAIGISKAIKDNDESIAEEPEQVF